jgi:hypothetical protein
MTFEFIRGWVRLQLRNYAMGGIVSLANASISRLFPIACYTGFISRCGGLMVTAKILLGYEECNKTETTSQLDLSRWFCIHLYL